jgi:hypothetical protein
MRYENQDMRLIYKLLIINILMKIQQIWDDLIIRCLKNLTEPLNITTQLI